MNTMERIKQIMDKDKTYPLPSYADLYTMKDFIEMVKDHTLVSDDGTGHYAGETWMYAEHVNFKNIKPERSTHVAWFNK